MQENQVVSFRVLSLGEALNAGFIPDGQNLRHKETGATLAQSTLNSHAGAILKGVGTGNAEFPVTLNGSILHKNFISKEVKRLQQTDKTGRKYDLVAFEDGAVFVDVPSSGFVLPLSLHDLNAIMGRAPAARDEE